MRGSHDHTALREHHKKEHAVESGHGLHSAHDATAHISKVLEGSAPVRDPAKGTRDHIVGAVTSVFHVHGPASGSPRAEAAERARLAVAIERSAPPSCAFRAGPEGCA